MQPALFVEPGPFQGLPGPAVGSKGPKIGQKPKGRIYHFILPSVCPVLEATGNGSRQLWAADGKGIVQTLQVLWANPERGMVSLHNACTYIKLPQCDPN